MTLFPIRYLEQNLVFNRCTGDVWAYYELFPYNYSCIGEDKALSIADEMERLVVGSRAQKLHFLMINIEESIHRTIGCSKAQVQGELKGVAEALLDGVEAQLKRYHGENELAVRFYIGFLLKGDDLGVSRVSSMEAFKAGVKDFLDGMHEAFGDYVRVRADEAGRYLRAEKTLYERIGKGLRFYRAAPKDIAYIIRHLNGQKGIAYEDYHYEPERIVSEDVRGMKAYDVIRLADSRMVSHGRYMDILTEDRELKASYLALSGMLGENRFPYGSEVLYYQQASFDFPVDVSVMVEVMDNRSSLSVVRNKKIELEDLDASAYESGNRASENLYRASADTEELEAYLERKKAAMCKVSYVLRVTGRDVEELKKHVLEVKDFYRSFNMFIQQPLCDQAGLHEEFYPSTDRYMNDYIQYVKPDFLSGLGFGAVQKLGEKDGIYIASCRMTGASVYIKPWLAAQGVAGSVTNALAKAFTGSLGGGKSVAMNLLALWSVLFGAKGLIIDPKGERKNWRRDLAFLGSHLNVIDVAASEENCGLFDPFNILPDVKEAEALALNVLTMMTGISMQDGERFPVLREHVQKVAEYTDRPRGMLCVIDELRKTDTDVSRYIARHIDSFSGLSIALLLFSDGRQRRTLDVDRDLNVVLVNELVLPEQGTAAESYSMTELLSVIILMVIASFSLEFVSRARGTFKFVTLDEAWSWLQTAEGRALGKKLVRTGRSLNAAIDLGTQNCADLLDETMKNNIGMKFAFRSEDIHEIEKTLEFMGLPKTEGNVALLKGLDNGECLFQDIYGHSGVIRIDCVYSDFIKAFDSRPPVQKAV